MRSRESIINAVVSIIMYIITILIGFISQAIFIKTLGNQYLGLNGLFGNIISILAIVELGFGSAIIYNLYRPLAENDKESIKSIMKYYKKIYRIIAFIVFILGLCILPFLNIIVGKISIIENIRFIFLLYLMDTVFSYFLSYKRSIFYADQKTYVINIVHIGYLILINALQISFLLIYRNYVAYLIIKIICRIIENLTITILANKKYSFLKEKNIQPLNSFIRGNIIKKVKGLFFHQIGSAIVLGTDNIIISMTLGVVTVGLYSNYNMIILAVNSLFSQAFNSITATVGNLLIEDDSVQAYRVYKNMLLLNFWIFTFVSIAVLCMVEPFITLWLGSSYILPKFVLIILVINLYIIGMRATCITFKNAAGIFYEDRFIPVLESLFNIVFSLLFVKFFGLAGVFMGTIVSSFPLYFYSYPKFVYGVILKESKIQFAEDYIKYMIVTFISALPTFLITELIHFNSAWMQLLFNGVMCLIIPNIICYIFFRETEEYQYCKGLIIGILRKIKK
ncbi:hypothetical protein LGL08_05375 [Clostridium estertheticum]|uniref:lipopolysaccharide biosynthesis protein n=1 Tax=Clostridium estertheticum TaxID=238834 RepID=UPI001CF588BF|nr:hypothetical protein [Clostridium estertheticum]MCB2306038.1 hypothetical protein [Clostridium estertheticum]MCB2346561.1 hypothetical protein [Clostridium estertheticum]MCB2348991.1 hypothetical protein [Clostridium estertheticum]WAG47632.1 hypothetical protein LL127_09410 [Clostridium estertheticum]